MPSVASHPSYYHHHQQQPLEQQQQQQQQLEEEAKVAHNVSISELISRGAFDFLQDSVIDVTPSVVTPTPPPINHQQPPPPAAAPLQQPPPPPASEAAVYLDPAVVSIGSVNNGNDLTANGNISEQQRYLQQHSTGTPPLASIQPPSFPPASISTVVPQPQSTTQYFSQSAGSFSAGGAAAGSVPAPPAAPAAVTLPTAVDTTPNPPPPIPMPQEHTNTNNWSREVVSESWADEPAASERWGADDSSPTPTAHHLNNGTDSPSMDDEKSKNSGSVSKWSNSSADRYHNHSSSHHSSKSWSMQPEPDMNWGSDEITAQQTESGSMHWEDTRNDHRMADYDRKNGRGPPRHRRMDDEDYDGGVFNSDDYDDRNRTGVYRRGGARGGRMNGGGGGGFRGRAYNGGYQNGGRGGGGNYGGFRGNRGMTAGGGNYRGGMRGNAPNRNGMPRGGNNSTGNNSTFRNSRNNYNNQRPFYGQQQQH